MNQAFVCIDTEVLSYTKFKVTKKRMSDRNFKVGEFAHFKPV